MPREAGSPAPAGARQRRSFAKIPEILDVPNLIAIQTDSFKWFLDEGLNDTFQDISPISDFTDTLAVEFGGHEFGDAKYSVEECKEKDMSYQAPLFVEVRFINKETGEMKEQQVFMGDFPLMTDRGTFVINGTERVVVSQLVRSPGAYFKWDIRNNKSYAVGSVIPSRGAWLEFEIGRPWFSWVASGRPMEADKQFGEAYVRVDRKRKVPATVLIRALGIAETEEEMLEVLGDTLRACAAPSSAITPPRAKRRSSSSTSACVRASRPTSSRRDRCWTGCSSTRSATTSARSAGSC